MFNAFKYVLGPCCSEHYLWLFDGNLYSNPFRAAYCCCAVISEDAKTTKASGPQTLSLKGGATWCHGVLDHGLNLHQNIPLILLHVTSHSEILDWQDGNEQKNN